MTIAIHALKIAKTIARMIISTVPREVGRGASARARHEPRCDDDAHADPAGRKRQNDAHHRVVFRMPRSCGG